MLGALLYFDYHARGERETQGRTDMISCLCGHHGTDCPIHSGLTGRTDADDMVISADNQAAWEAEYNAYLDSIDYGGEG